MNTRSIWQKRVYDGRWEKEVKWLECEHLGFPQCDFPIQRNVHCSWSSWNPSNSQRSEGWTHRSFVQSTVGNGGDTHVKELPSWRERFSWFVTTSPAITLRKRKCSFWMTMCCTPLTVFRAFRFRRWKYWIWATTVWSLFLRRYSSSTPLIAVYFASPFEDTLFGG